jgi:hypothetical protein
MTRLSPTRPQLLWWSRRGLQFVLTYVLFLGILFVVYLALHSH